MNKAHYLKVCIKIINLTCVAGSLTCSKPYDVTIRALSYQLLHKPFVFHFSADQTETNYRVVGFEVEPSRWVFGMRGGCLGDEHWTMYTIQYNWILIAPSFRSSEKCSTIRQKIDFAEHCSDWSSWWTKMETLRVNFLINSWNLSFSWKRSCMAIVQRCVIIITLRNND